jgi:hypothetical protein
MIVALVSCSSDSIEATDSLSEITGQLALGDHVRAAELIDRYDHTSSDRQVAFMSAAICQPESLRFLVEELGFSPAARTDSGQTIVYDQTFYDGSPLVRSCPDEVRAASIEYLISEGADPCRGPDESPELSPATRAAEWGAPAEVVAALQSYADDC